MLQEYFYEIIASIVVLTLVVIYFLIRKFKQEEEEFHNYQYKKPELIQDPYEDPYQELYQEELLKENSKKPQVSEVKEQSESDEEFILKAEHEGSFGDIQSNPFEENPTTKSKKDEGKKAIVKKEIVPSQGKRRKEDFKDFEGINILMAEDNIINQKVVSGVLDGTGINLTIANDGQEALDILQKNSDFQVILMDVHMPNLDGYEATRAIRANPDYEHILIVALSGDVAVDDLRKMDEAGMHEHLEKPLQINCFYDILHAYTKDEAGEQNTPNPLSSKVAEMDTVRTSEINGEKGLTICGGDEEFYKDILAEFTQTFTGFIPKLKTNLQENNIESADKLLLDLVGLSANIGATNVRNIALALKTAIKNPKERRYLNHLDDLDIHLDSLLKDIEAYQKEH